MEDPRDTGHDGEPRHGGTTGLVLGLLAGAIVGFTVSTVVYVLVGPVLERSEGLVREAQGLLWNLVPLLTLLGAAAGWWSVAAHRRRRARHSDARRR